MTEGKFDHKLIPEFDGSASGPSVVEWMEKAELVCKMYQAKHRELTIPLRLMGGAFAVFHQLKEEDKMDFDRIKAALFTAFAADGFMAFDQFAERWIYLGESVDVYLAELQRLLGLFGGISNQSLACAFVRGLPDRVKSLLRASTRMDGLSIDQLLARARASMKDNTMEAGLAVAAVHATRDKTKSPDSGDLYDLISCHRCNDPNHFAKDCERPGTGKRAPRIRCYKCKALGHISHDCPGNELGE